MVYWFMQICKINYSIFTTSRNMHDLSKESYVSKIQWFHIADYRAYIIMQISYKHHTGVYYITVSFNTVVAAIYRGQRYWSSHWRWNIISYFNRKWHIHFSFTSYTLIHLCYLMVYKWKALFVMIRNRIHGIGCLSFKSWWPFLYRNDCLLLGIAAYSQILDSTLSIDLQLVKSWNVFWGYRAIANHLTWHVCMYVLE